MPLPAQELTCKLLQTGVDRTFQSGPFGDLGQRGPRVAERKIRPPLVGIGAVVDHIAGKIVLPGSHQVEQQLPLHVDEHRQVVAADGNVAPFQTVDLGRYLIGREVIFLRRLFRQRLVLVLGPKGPFVLQPQVHGMLDGR